MSRPPRESLPPTSALFSGGSRPDRPSPPNHSLSSFSKQDDSFYHPSSSEELDIPTLPSYPDQQQIPRVQFKPPSTTESRANLIPISSIDSTQQHHHQHLGIASTSNNAPFQRKKSLVRPDRERIDENHRLYNYRAHAALMQAEGRGVAGVSRTGHYASAGLPLPPFGRDPQNQKSNDPGGASNNNLRRGKSILAREEGMAVNESGLSMFKRGTTLRRPTLKKINHSDTSAHRGGGSEKARGAERNMKKEPLGPWMIFCLALTICCPSPLLKCFGLRTKERQSAWREKMGFLAVIGIAMCAVGFLTFGFTKSVCGTPALRYHAGTIGTGSMIFQGYNYDLDKFQHPNAAGIEGGTNPLYDLFGAASMDGSFLFQNVNENCLEVITAPTDTGIVVENGKLGWYFPCNLYNQWGSTTVNLTGYAEGVMCHTQSDARSQFAALKPLGQVYFSWEDLKNSSRNLGVYDGSVLDFDLLNWLSRTQVTYPALFDEIKTGNASYRGRDITALMVASKQQQIARCMVDVIRVGFIDSVTIGCVASDVVLYVSLVVIIGVVMLRFCMAVFFGWFMSWKIGRFPRETYAEKMARSAEIERWTDDIYRPAPGKYRPNVKQQKKTMFPATSRFTKGDGMSNSGSPRTDNKYGEFRKSSPSTVGIAGGTTPPYGGKSTLGAGMRNSPPGSPGGKPSRSSSSLPLSAYNFESLLPRSSTADGMMGACPFPLIDVVPQPPPDFEPFNYPLAHTILLVTAYSESIEGLRTTLDSLATTDYPNSHKVILVIADGMVKGSGNSLTTPEIVLGMMKELVVQSDDVDAHSYVAIADGHKRHNRAKVYAGFYEYDNNTVEMSKQQRVPMLLVAKVGNDLEAGEAKPGNRGKRDSQIILMAFLQKVMFDERMSSFEYEFFNALWRCTGVSPDRYETVLCVDADTKVFPDSVSRMVSCMVHDPEIMGLCGETKVANKSETWVTMMQVFEYYSAHHLSKAFESVFGGVTCLPGCFSMYRIKAPKGGDGYWVPILANPDIVEHYSENVVDTLHKKNLLLLGEDRYLTTLMLRTFPRRKMMFCPQAVCKTVVPDTFRVLLSQRRRWINSTVHNLLELIVVPDLCGVFCFSMRFVIFMELAGTLVLPAAISFTIYLIVIAIIPGTVKPIISLILLGIILGIPGLLIVLTSRKVSYLGWMIVYILSLPVWNFVLPLYAFLHMDDFSWGQTRKVVGDTGQGHTGKVGDFDSSHIIMKRWAEFERDRRYRSGSHSRDSTYDVLHRSNSPQRTTSNRFSTVSSLDTFVSGTGGSGVSEPLFRRSSPGHSHGHSTSEGHVGGPRYPQQLELPAPLAVRGSSPGSSTGSIPQYDTSESLPKPYDDAYTPSLESSGLHTGLDYPRYLEQGYDSDEVEPILRHSPQLVSRGSLDAPAFPAQAYDGAGRESPVYYSEPETLSSIPASLQVRSGRSSNASPGYERSDSLSSRSSNPTSGPPPSGSSSTLGGHRRGISLVDDGPVPGSQGFRTVQRQRRASQGPAPPSHRTSQGPAPPLQRPRNSAIVDTSDFVQSPTVGPISPTLPPGAAPARPPSSSRH